MTIDISLTTYPGLDERISILRAGDVVDAVLVRTKRFDVLIDTLDSPSACRAALDLLGQAQRRELVTVNSHMDWDHFWGNAAVADRSPIIAHDRALERFHAPATLQTLNEKSRTDERFGPVTLHAPTITFSDRLRIDGGDLTLHLLPTPGHTPDHIAVWIPECRVCLAVDAVESPIPEVWSDDPADLRALVASLRLIESLGAEHVVLAHGQTSSPDMVARNLRYFETLADRVRRLGRICGETELPEGLRLWDIIEPSQSLTTEARVFYEKCHHSNLRATIRSLSQVYPAA